MKPGDRVHLDLGKPSRPFTGAPDRHNRCFATFVKMSPDGEWCQIHMGGSDMPNNLRTVRPTAIKPAPKDDP